MRHSDKNYKLRVKAQIQHDCLALLHDLVLLVPRNAKLYLSSQVVPGFIWHAETWTTRRGIASLDKSFSKGTVRAWENYGWITLEPSDDWTPGRVSRRLVALTPLGEQALEDFKETMS